MDKTETLATLVTRHRKKSSKTKNLMVNQEWIRQRHWQHWSQDTGRSQAKQKNLMVNQEWIIQRHWQHWSQDTGRSQAKQKT